MPHARKGRTKSPSGNCVKCSNWRQSLHRDHIIPRWKGGTEDPSNIQLLCANCHEDKTREDMKGHPVSEEQKIAHSKRMKGRKASEATKQLLSKIRLGIPKGPWSQERKNSILEERRNRWTTERRLAHSILGQKDWDNLTEQERIKRISGLALSKMSEEALRNAATKASLVAKKIRGVLTPQEKILKRQQRAETHLAKLKAQLVAQENTEKELK